MAITKRYPTILIGSGIAIIILTFVFYIGRYRWLCRVNKSTHVGAFIFALSIIESQKCLLSKLVASSIMILILTSNCSYLNILFSII